MGENTASCRALGCRLITITGGQAGAGDWSEMKSDDEMWRRAINAQRRGPKERTNSIKRRR